MVGELASELRDEGDEGGIRQLEREKKNEKEKRRKKRNRRERERKKRENILLIREEREV